MWMQPVVVIADSLKPVVVIADSLKWTRYGSLWICWSSQRSGWWDPKLISDILYQKKTITKWRFSFISILPIASSCCISIFSGRCITVRTKPCWRLVSYDTGPDSAKFCRLQFRLRLQPKRSTPTDFNSGLDSDSAALHGIVFSKIYQEGTSTE